MKKLVSIVIVIISLLGITGCVNEPGKPESIIGGSITEETTESNQIEVGTEDVTETDILPFSFDKYRAEINGCAGNILPYVYIYHDTTTDLIFYMAGGSGYLIAYPNPEDGSPMTMTEYMELYKQTLEKVEE